MKIFQLPSLPQSVSHFWSSWRMRLRHSKRDCGDLIVKAVVWNIWLTRNDCIFYVNVLLAFYIILKIDHVLLFWFSLVSDGLK